MARRTHAPQRRPSPHRRRSYPPVDLRHRTAENPRGPQLSLSLLPPPPPPPLRPPHIYIYISLSPQLLVHGTGRRSEVGLAISFTNVFGLSIGIATGYDTLTVAGGRRLFCNTAAYVRACHQRHADGTCLLSRGAHRTAITVVFVALIPCEFTPPAPPLPPLNTCLNSPREGRRIRVSSCIPLPPPLPGSLALTLCCLSL